MSFDDCARLPGREVFVGNKKSVDKYKDGLVINLNCLLLIERGAYFAAAAVLCVAASRSRAKRRLCVGFGARSAFTHNKWSIFAVNHCTPYLPPASAVSFSFSALPRLRISSSASTSSGDKLDSASASMDCPSGATAPSLEASSPVAPAALCLFRRTGGAPPMAGGVGRPPPPRASGWAWLGPSLCPLAKGWDPAPARRLAWTLISPSLNTETLLNARRSTLYARNAFGLRSAAPVSRKSLWLAAQKTVSVGGVGKRVRRDLVKHKRNAPVSKRAGWC